MAKPSREPVIPVSRIDARLRQIDHELENHEALKIERQTLLRLKTGAVLSGLSRSTVSTGNGAEPPKMTDAVLEVVRRNPGLAKSQVGDRVVEQTGKPRDVVMTTIGNLIRRGRVNRDENGGLVVG